jgi:hypothetical protein
MSTKTLKTAVLAGTLGVIIGASAVYAKTLYASHPMLHRAHSQLKAAKAALDKVTHDCGGHRATAIAKVDAALEETRLAVEYADAHPQEDTAK